MRITLNGREKEIEKQTAFSLRDSVDGKDAVVIVNGFQIGEDCALHEGDEVFVIPKGTMPPKDQFEAMMAARHTPHVHERLKRGKVAVAGLGGLGSHIAVALARSGVGHLTLVDFDTVEPSNLNRQSYGIRHLGMAKTQALHEQIAEINPFIEVETHCLRVDEAQVAQLFSGCAVLCEAFDRPEAKAMLVNTAMRVLPEMKIVAASGMAGYYSANSIQTRRPLKNLYLCGDGENAADFGTGLMAPRVMVCAGHQANMVLRLLLGIEEV